MTEMTQGTRPAGEAGYQAAPAYGENPLAIYCSACGAPAEFDIIKQTYHCAYCGSDTAVGRALDEQRARKQFHKARIYQEAADISEELAHCPNCGADVLLGEGEALSHCDYCGANVVRGSWVKDSGNSLPEMIIPFYITEEEAAEQLRRWIRRHPFHQAARCFKGRENELKAYYLPYEIVRGSVVCDVERSDADRPFTCGSYLEGMAINCSDQLDNSLLDGMEPYDWSEARPFAFGYVAGHKAKLPDISERFLSTRIAEELTDTYYPTLKRTLKSSEIRVDVDASDTLKIPALLPVFFLRDAHSECRIVINGQTGRVAATDGKIRKAKPWVIEPIIITLLFALLGWLLFRTPEHALLMAFVFGAIAFAVLSERRGEVELSSVKRGGGAKFSRSDPKLEKYGSRAFLNKPQEKEPVFFEPVEGRKATVRISFYDPLRMFFGAVIGLTVAALPYVVAFILLVIFSLVQGTTAPVENAFWGGGIVWICIAVPVGLGYWLMFGRKMIFNYPYFYRAQSRGRGQRVHSDRDLPWTLTEHIFHMIGIPPVIIGGLVLLIILVLVILSGN